MELKAEERQMKLKADKANEAEISLKIERSRCGNDFYNFNKKGYFF